MVDETKAYIVDPGQILNKAIKEALLQVNDLRIPYHLITQSWFKTNLSLFDMSRRGPGKYPILGGLNPFEKRGKNKLTNYQIAARAKIKEVGFMYPLLVRSGKVANSMTQPRDSNAVSMIVNKTILVLGTKAKSKDGYPYPIALQVAGGKAQYKPRPMVLIGVEQVVPGQTNKRELIWAEIISDHVVKKMAQVAKRSKL